MTFAEKAHEYLLNNPGQGVCDWCLSKRFITTTKLANQAVNSLCTIFRRNIYRGTGKCAACGNKRVVTAFVPPRSEWRQ